MWLLVLSPYLFNVVVDTVSAYKQDQLPRLKTHVDVIALSYENRLMMKLKVNLWEGTLENGLKLNVSET